MHARISPSQEWFVKKHPLLKVKLYTGVLNKNMTVTFLHAKPLFYVPISCLMSSYLSPFIGLTSRHPTLPDKDKPEPHIWPSFKIIINKQL